MTNAGSPPGREFVGATHVTVDAPLDLDDVGKDGQRTAPML
jgi:hypothetical protein